MAIETTYYIDGATFDVATSVYLNSDLSLIAPDGWYKFDTVSRQQSAGILLASEECETCPTYCESNIGITSSGGKAVYLIRMNQYSNIGAIIIKFNPNNIPKGILANFDGVTYNKLSSPNWGVLESPNSSNWTVIGTTANDCGLSGATTIYTYTEKEWDGTSFVNTGSTYPVTTLASDVLLQSTAVGVCVMVIPKPTSTDGFVVIEVLGTCSSADFSIEIDCATPLVAFPSSSRVVLFPPLVPPSCNTPLNQIYYYAKVTNTSTSLQGYDYVFTDPNGQYPLADGYYYFNYVSGHTNIGVYRITNGVVTSLTYTSCT